jgi:hypothetical protein
VDTGIRRHDEVVWCRWVNALGRWYYDADMNYAGFPVLGELDPALLERVLAHCRIAAYREQDIILHRGAVNEDLHFVLSGRVQVHFDMSDRSDPIEIGAGQMFGEMSVIDQLPVSAFIVNALSCKDRITLVSTRGFRLLGIQSTVWTK